MSKIKEHLQNWGLIYLILIVCGIILLITLNITSKEVEPEYVDTSMFHVVTLEEANKLFESKDAKLLVISVKTCGATMDYVSALQIEQAKRKFTTQYLELSDIDTDSEEFGKLLENLDFQVTMNDERGTLAGFLGNTPMTIIIKNKNIVYAFIGSLNTSVVDALVTKYEVV